MTSTATTPVPTSRRSKRRENPTLIRAGPSSIPSNRRRCSPARRLPRLNPRRPPRSRSRRASTFWFGWICSFHWWQFDFYKPPNVFSRLDEYLLPDDLLFLRVQRCMSQGDHLWPGEFPDLDKSKEQVRSPRCQSSGQRGFFVFRRDLLVPALARQVQSRHERNQGNQSATRGAVETREECLGAFR